MHYKQLLDKNSLRTQYFYEIRPKNLSQKYHLKLTLRVSLSLQFWPKKNDPGKGRLNTDKKCTLNPTTQYGTHLLYQYAYKYAHRSSHAAPESGSQAEPLNGSCRSKR